MKTKTIKLSDIKIGFGEKNPPKDDYLVDLLRQAYREELLCFAALIKTEGIKPESDYKPEISEQFRKWFERKIEENSPPPLYVYPKADVFIMGDDYGAYNLYLEKGYKEVICIILGDSNSVYIIEKSKPFKLPLPTVEVIDK